MRLDKLLWYLRLARTRGLAQGIVTAGHVRINGRRAERCAHPVACGDVLTIPLGNRVVVIELLAIPLRRGPPGEAQACYRALDASPDLAIATGATSEATGTPLP